MRNKLLYLLPVALSVTALAGCRQDMHNQPKYRGLRPSTFFADGSSARPLVEGTVARGTFFAGSLNSPDGTMRMADLARAVSRSPSALTRMVSRLAIETGVEGIAIGYTFDIVLAGSKATPMGV